MLLDPLEEDLYFPSVHIQNRDLQSRGFKMIGQVYIRLIMLFVVVLYPAKIFWVIFSGVVSFEPNGLVASQPGGFIHFAGVDPFKGQIVFSPDDKIGTGLVYFVQPGPVNIAAVHNVKGIRLKLDNIQHIDIVNRSVGNVNKAGDFAFHIQ